MTGRCGAFFGDSSHVLRASVGTATAVKPGFFRNANLRSFMVGRGNIEH
jgi:hypothetical protein